MKHQLFPPPTSNSFSINTRPRTKLFPSKANKVLFYNQKNEASQPIILAFNTQSLKLQSKQINIIDKIPPLNLRSLNGKNQDQLNQKKASTERSSQVKKDNDQSIHKKLSAKDSKAKPNYISENNRNNENNERRPNNLESKESFENPFEVTTQIKVSKSQRVHKSRKRTINQQIILNDQVVSKQKATTLRTESNSPYRYLKPSHQMSQNSPNLFNQQSKSTNKPKLFSAKTVQIGLNQMMNKSRAKRKISEQLISVPLNFKTPSQLSKLKTEQSPENEEKYSYAKIYDQQIITQQTRSKKNSKVELWQV